MKFTTVALVAGLAAGTQTWTFAYPDEKICGLDLKTDKDDAATKMASLFAAELLCHPSDLSAKMVATAADAYFSGDKTLVQVNTALAVKDGETTIPSPVLFGPANITFTVDKDDCGVAADKYNITIGKKDGAIDGTVPTPTAWFAVNSITNTNKVLTLSVAETNTTMINLDNVVSISSPGSTCTPSGSVTLGLYSTPLKHGDGVAAALVASASLTLAAGLLL